MLSFAIDDKSVRLPALATAHSHAFQRAMRGTAQRRGSDPKDDFWTWRGQMYRAASALTPESIYSIARVAYAELRRAGIHTVGEFHYVHHQTDGTPYDDRTVLSDAMIRAAKDEGLRIALLRVAYHRAGPGRDAERGQKRFCDPKVDDVLRDLDTLFARYGSDPDVRIGVAPHSVRAVPPSWIRPLADYATAKGAMFHMHVAEQIREVDECVSETGHRPIAFLAEQGALSSRFVAVHATNLTDEEAILLGKTGGFACICPTTERDLGDGLPNLTALRQAGVRLCNGIDSYIVTDPIEELRALETHERLRTRARVTFQNTDEIPSHSLWMEGSHHGELACGFAESAADVVIRRTDPALALVDERYLVDAIVFSGNAGMIAAVETKKR